MKKYIFLLLSVLLIAFSAYKYIMAPTKDIVASKADIFINATDLIKEFSADLTLATKKYEGKILQVNGVITELKDNSISLNNKINGVFKLVDSYKKNQTISIKGLFIGYDDLFDEIKLDQCTVIE